jgi:hypothetical protein
VCLSEYAVAHAIDLLKLSWQYASHRLLWRGLKRRKKAAAATEAKDTGSTINCECGPGEEPFLMSASPHIEKAFCDYARCLAITADFISSTREEVAGCLLHSHFPRRVVEAVCVCKYVGTSLAVDATSALRKLMGSRALQEEAKLGAGSFSVNVTCAAEGDDAVLELKVVSDALRGGMESLLPFDLVWRTLTQLDPRGLRKRLLWLYLRKALYALLLAMVNPQGLLRDGQLLKDLAWARAHLLLLDCFVSAVLRESRGPRAAGDYRHAGRWAGEVGSLAASKGREQMLAVLGQWVESYERVMARFPTPVQV